MPLPTNPQAFSKLGHHRLRLQSKPSAASAETTSFHLFPNLPTEIRLRIWHHTLPFNTPFLEPALYFYREGCWVGRRELRSKEDPDHHLFPYRRYCEFQPQLLNTTQFDVPHLTFVNYEARQVILNWIRDLGLELEEIKHQQSRYTIIRRYDPTRDAVYVEPDLFHRLRQEPYRLAEKSTLRGYRIESHFGYIAFPESAVRESNTTAFSNIYLHFRVHTMLVVPDLPPKRPGEAQILWEYREAGGLIWNLGKQEYYLRLGKPVPNPDILDLLKKIGFAIAGGLTVLEEENFQILQACTQKRQLS